MDVLHFDIETRSVYDLKKGGLHNYAADSTTDVWCVAYSFNDFPVRVWMPGERVPASIQGHFAAGLPCWAHNVAFEYHITNEILHRKYNWPKLKIEQCFCTMACCFAMGLPGTLERAAAALGVAKGKDMAGSRVMLQLAKPKKYNAQGVPEFWDDAEKTKRLIEYCKQDVEVEKEIHKRVLPLSENERKIWLMDFRINERGVEVDLPSVKTAAIIADLETDRLNEEMQKVSGGVIGSTNSTAQIRDFLVYYGIEVESVDKENVVALLQRKDLPPVCKKILQLRQEGGKSSVAKLDMMLKGVGKRDKRIRGLFQYHAAATGRFGGRRIQPHNLPRPNLGQKEIDHVFSIFRANKTFREKRDQIEMFYDRPLGVISDCLRGFLVAGEGKVLVSVDFSQIEARITAWLPNEEKVLKEFAGGGKVYEQAAAGIYHKPIELVTSKERQIGKVAVLSLGFGGGKVAFMGMAAQNGILLSEEEAEEIKLNWRANNPKIVEYWKELENAAISAVLRPGLSFSVSHNHRRTFFKKAGSFLWAKIPSGRLLCYPYPQIKPVKTPWGHMKDALTYMGVGLNQKWERQSTYGGSLCENVVQACARDILTEAMLKLKEANYPIVLHVHDEIVAEVADDFNGLNFVEDFVSQPPVWAAGLPLKAEGWMGKRYRK